MAFRYIHIYVRFSPCIFSHSLSLLFSPPPRSWPLARPPQNRARVVHGAILRPVHNGVWRGGGGRGGFYTLAAGRVAAGSFVRSACARGRINARPCTCVRVCGLRRRRRRRQRATVSILLVGENGDSAVRVLRPDERASVVTALQCAPTYYILSSTARAAARLVCVYILREPSASGRRVVPLYPYRDIQTSAVG